MSDYDLGDRDPEIERRWAEELRRRIQAVKSGEMKLISMEESDAEVELLLADDDAPAADSPQSSHTRG
jgi:hypothetical protein